MVFEPLSFCLFAVLCTSEVCFLFVILSGTSLSYHNLLGGGIICMTVKDARARSVVISEITNGVHRAFTHSVYRVTGSDITYSLAHSD